MKYVGNKNVKRWRFVFNTVCRSGIDSEPITLFGRAGGGRGRKRKREKERERGREGGVSGHASRISDNVDDRR